MIWTSSYFLFFFSFWGVFWLFTFSHRVQPQLQLEI